MLWTLLLASSGLASDVCDDSARVADVTATLNELHDADRTSAGREERLAQVRQLDGEGVICTPEMAYLAARLLRRGTAEDGVRALALAEQAHAAHYPKAGWLVAITADRVAADLGELQPYGTLTAQVDGLVCIYEIDPAVTDEARRALQAKTLADAYGQVLAKNGVSDAEPTVDALRARSMLCPSRVQEARAPAPLTGGRVVGRMTNSGSERSGFGLSVMLRLLPLLGRHAELSGEYQATDRFGIALIGGAGLRNTYPSWSAGLSLRGYPVGNFHEGMQAGMDLRVFGSTFESDGVSVTGQHLFAGPILGVKAAADFGLTFEAQVGYGVYSGSVQYSGLDAVDDLSVGGFGPMLNAALGWTF